MFHKILLFVGVAFNILAQLSIRQGMREVGIVELNSNLLGKLKSMFFNPYLLVGILCYGMGFVLYSVVLSRVNLSRAYPVASVTAIVAISILSVLLFNEALDPFKIIGILLCVAGIFFIFV